MPDIVSRARGREVVVAVSGFGDLRPVLRQAARLAASLDADLAALLVENEGLHRMAALPFAEQVSFATARRVPMQTGDLERELIAFGRIAERTIADVAREAGIAGRVQMARGRAAEALRTAARPGDLVMICAVEPIGAGGGASGLAEAALAGLPDCDLLLHDLRPGATNRIAVCDDGTETARRAIATAMALARAHGAKLRMIELDRLDTVRSVLGETTPSVLVLPASLADRIGRMALMRTSGCAVLVVR